MPRQKFGQIYQELKSRIENEVYQVGQLLPSEAVLISEFDCSRNTVRRAIAQLVKEGYVQTHQGRGVCNIYQKIEKAAYTMGTIESFGETSLRTGQKTSTRVIAFSQTVADLEISKKTGFSIGTPLFNLCRIHDIDNIPSILNLSYLRIDCMPELTAQIAQGSLYRYLENELGMEIVTAKRTITVEKTTELDKTLLNLGNYNCVAVVSNQVYNSLGIMFEYTQSRHHPDFFKFQDNAIRHKA